VYTPLYWRYFIHYVPTGFDMRKIARPLSIVLSDISMVIYIYRSLAVYILYTHIYVMYIIRLYVL